MPLLSSASLATGSVDPAANSVADFVALADSVIGSTGFPLIVLLLVLVLLAIQLMFITMLIFL